MMALLIDVRVMIPLLSFLLLQWSVLYAYDDCKTYNSTSNIIYMKMHKCSSSTLTNMFHNYVTVHNRSCVLPLPPAAHGGKTWNFKLALARKEITCTTSTTGQRYPKFEFWVNHVIYDPFLKDLIPGGRFLGSVREPVARYQSWIEWNYNENKKYKSMEHFLHKKPITDMNSMCRALGLQINNQTGWDRILNDDYFLFVVERLEVSLLVFRRKFNWAFEDIVTFTEKHTKGKKLSMTTETHKWLLQKHDCDQRLYEYANERLNQQIKCIYGKEGEASALLAEDKKKYTATRKKVRKKCATQKESQKSAYCQSAALDNIAWVTKERNKIKNYDFMYRKCFNAS